MTAPSAGVAVPGRKALIVINAVAFQIGWFACVLGAAGGRPGIGLSIAAAVVALHLGTTDAPAREGLLLLAAVAIGLVWDSFMIRSGLISYAAPGPLPGWAPAWILALWALFASSLNVSLGWLQGRWLWAVVLGAVAGPMSYAGAAKLGACELLQPRPAVAALSAGWAVLTPLLLWLAARARPPTEVRHA